MRSGEPVLMMKKEANSIWLCSTSSFSRMAFLYERFWAFKRHKETERESEREREKERERESAKRERARRRRSKNHEKRQSVLVLEAIKFHCEFKSERKDSIRKQSLSASWWNLVKLAFFKIFYSETKLWIIGMQQGRRNAFFTTRVIFGKLHLINGFF